MLERDMIAIGEGGISAVVGRVGKWRKRRKRSERRFEVYLGGTGWNGMEGQPDGTMGREKHAVISRLEWFNTRWEAWMVGVVVVVLLLFWPGGVVLPPLLLLAFHLSVLHAIFFSVGGVD